MKIIAIVPAKQFERSKSRLASLLTVAERVKLSELLLYDTLSTLRKASTISRIVVVSSDKCAKEIATRMGVLFLQQQTDEGVNSAIALADDYCLLTGTEASIVLPQDLPLLLPQDVVEICQLAKTSEKCMIICPSLRYDGSNALLRKPPILFSTKYDNDSYNMHRKEALSVGAHVRVILLERIMKDIDTADDALSLVGEPGKGGALRYLKQKLQSKKQVIQD